MSLNETFLLSSSLYFYLINYCLYLVDRVLVLGYLVTRLNPFTKHIICAYSHSNQCPMTHVIKAVVHIILDVVHINGFCQQQVSYLIISVVLKHMSDVDITVNRLWWVCFEIKHLFLSSAFVLYSSSKVSLHQWACWEISHPVIAPQQA